MDKYIGTSNVIARPMTLGLYNEYRGWAIPDNENPDDPGYLVTHTKTGDSTEGHVTWVPQEVFMRMYRPITGLTFGQAIEALKAGKKVCREGWNGRGMYLWLKPATVIKTEWCRDPYLKAITEDNGGAIEALGTICMYTTDSKGRRAVLTGWLASQADILQEDWQILDEEAQCPYL